MKGFLSFLMVLGLLFMAGCSPSTQTWTEQYDLGVRYVSEGKYEEAVITFQKAIEIDPKQVKPYSALAEIYVTQGDMEKAAEILHQGVQATGDEALDAAADAMDAWSDGNVGNNNNIVDEQGRDIRRNYYDAEGNLDNYQILYYGEGEDAVRSDNYNAVGEMESYTLYYNSEDGLRSYSESFFPDGTSAGGKTVQVMDEEGNWLYNARIDENGNEIKTTVPVNDETGSGWNNYDENGTLISYARSENGRIVYYNADGTVEMMSE